MSKICLGADIGTMNLVVSRRTGENEIKHRKEINAFVELPLENRNTFNWMKKAGIPLIERDNMAYVIGQAAMDMAFTMKGIELKRPMSGGCLNPREKDAFRILTAMIHSLVGKLEADEAILYYCIPANAVNADTDADYHQKVIQSIFDSYKVDNKKITAVPLNEALALIYAELGEKQYTGIGLSCGCGMVNFCYSIYGTTACQFSIVNSGDWIDAQAAKATAETPTYINKIKHSIDLTKTPSNGIERAIHAQYRIMIEKTVQNMKTALTGAANIRSDGEVDMIVAGGTASPNGFVELLKEAIKEAQLPIQIGNIRKPEDCLYTVARGLLLAAEVSQQ